MRVNQSFASAAQSIGKKKTEVALCLFYSSLSGVQTGIPSGPSGGIPSPLLGSELRLCRPFATLFYLSTLPPASPSLPSAVGHSSVAVGIGNITNLQKFVNLFLKIFFKSTYLRKTSTLATGPQVQFIKTPLGDRIMRAIPRGFG